MRNYSYVVALHISKSWGLDWVGFSHEYGRDCIPVLEKWSDVRLLIPLAMLLTSILVTLFVLLRKNPQQILGLLVHFSWMATLFPISGVVKVGTFVADRIVVASTVSTSILIGTWLSQWLLAKKTSKIYLYLKILVITILLATMWFRVHVRTLQWMDSLPLLQSSLRTCPNSAKSHLEMSKVHSGLYPDLLDLPQSLQHLKRVQEIDADYCDVHYQFAHVYIQTGNYLEFEKELLEGILCPFTMAGAVELWRRYWQVATLQPGAKERHERYNRIIQAAIEEEQRKSQEDTL